ncbi:hypothetical protein OB985_29970 [Bacillus cereus]|nr:hypothetical protein [Bacillus cereus]
MDASTLSVAFIPREKYSKSVESLEALVGELPISSQIVIFDTGYPKCIKEELLGIVTRLKLQHVVDIVELGGFVNTNKILNIFIKMAKSERLMCLENDVVINTGCIKASLEALDNSEGDFIVPKVYEGELLIPHFNPSVSEIIRIKDGQLRSFLDRGRHDEKPLISGRVIKHLERHCFFTKKSTIKILGGFDEEMHCRTDIDLSLCAFKKNLTIYIPELGSVVFYPKPSVTIDDEIFPKRWDVESVRCAQERLVEKHKLYRFKTSIDHAYRAVASFKDEISKHREMKI